MNKRKRGILEQNLYSSLIAYRLNQEILIIENEVNKLKGDAAVEKTGFKKIVDKVVSPIRNHQEKKASDEYIKASNNLHDYIVSLEEQRIDYSYYKSEERINKLMDSLFHKDNGTGKLSLALELAISDGVENIKFLREEESLRSLSILLFNDENMMTNLRKVYEYCFRKIENKKFFDDLSLGVILGSTSVALSIINPILTVIAGAGLVSAYFIHKKVKESKPDESLLMFSTLVAGGRTKLSKHMIKFFKSVDKDSLAHALATGLVIYNFTFTNKESVEAKEALSNYIQMIDDLRGDEEYFALVEKDNIEEHYQKIEICNRAVLLLKDVITKNIEVAAKATNSNPKPQEA